METIIPGQTYVPHNPKDLFPPVDPFGLELPKRDNNPDTCSNKILDCRNIVMKQWEKRCIVPRVRWSLWSLWARRCPAVPSCPLSRSPQGGHGDLWRPKMHANNNGHLFSVFLNVECF